MCDWLDGQFLLGLLVVVGIKIFEFSMRNACKIREGVSMS